MQPFWTDAVLRLGFPVVVVLAMIRGYLVPGFIYDRVVKENERLTKVSEEKVIPLAVEGQRLLRDALEVMEEREDAAKALQASKDREELQRYRDGDSPK